MTTATKIAGEIAAKHGFTMTQIRTLKYHRRATVARVEIMRALREVLNFSGKPTSITVIGRMTGVHWTTVFHHLYPDSIHVRQKRERNRLAKQARKLARDAQDALNASGSDNPPTPEGRAPEARPGAF